MENEENQKIVMWIVIENIFTIVVTAISFYFTGSAWVFLFLFNISTIKVKSNTKTEE